MTQTDGTVPPTSTPGPTRSSDDRAADRVFWRSRRGLLELDLLLVPFAEQAFSALTPALQTTYAEMLDFEDVEIYAWISRREAPPDAFTDVIERVQAFHGLNG